MYRGAYKVLLELQVMHFWPIMGRSEKKPKAVTNATRMQPWMLFDLCQPSVRGFDRLKSLPNSFPR
jgi:hypothetical protein